MSFKRPSCSGVLFLAAVVVAMGGAPSAQGAEVGPYTVVLDAPSVGQRLSLSRGRPDRPTPAPVALSSMTTMARTVARQQQPLIASLEDLGAEPLGSVQNVLNAVFVRASPAQAKAIASLPGVASVVRSRRFEFELDAVAEVIGLAAARSSLGGADATGAGIKIAVIDSGLDLDHAAFRDDTMPALPGYPKGRPEHLRFANNKVVALRTYLHLLNSGEPETSTPDDTSPYDATGHGTAVAMVAAGVRTDSPAGPQQGVAPGAHLGVYKVSGTPGINTHATSHAIIAAIDDAVADGMDILNLSLGAPAATPWDAQGRECGERDPWVACDPLAVAAQSAVVDFGRVVVAAAGNSAATGPLGSPALNSVSTPAIAPDVIAVAATWNSREIVQGVRVGSAAYPALNGSGPAVHAPLTAPLAVAGDFGHSLACEPFPIGSLAGRIALVRRGDCFFEDKIENADAAGAIAVIVYDDQPADELLLMGAIGDTDIPAFFIGGNDGGALVAKARESQPGASLHVTLDPFLEARPTNWAQVAEFSGRGPSPGLNLKPDVAAPGLSVYTAAVGGAAGPAARGHRSFRESGGTSMAAPAVAGAAALVWQRHPQFTVREVASALINTASRTVVENGEFARLPSVGSGLLNVSAALEPVATVEPPTIAFGAVDASGLPAWQEILVTNRTTQPQSYRMAAEPRDRDPSASVALDGFQDIGFSLDPGQHVRIRVSLEGTVPSPGSYEGWLRLSRNAGGSDLLVPYLYVVGDGQVRNAIPVTEDFEIGASGESARRYVGAKFVDRYGVPVASLPVRFIVREGSARIGSAGSATDAYGVAHASVEWGPVPGPQVVVAAAGGLEVPFHFESEGARPSVISVFSGASSETGRPLAPGSLVGVFGTGFARFEGAAQAAPYPIKLKSVSASMDFPEMHLSLPAPLYHVQGGVIGLQVPWELAGLNFAHLKVRVGNSFGDDFVSDPIVVDLSDVSPGIFLLDTPHGRAPALEHPDGSLVSASSPARRGDTVTILMTGNGPRQRPVATGSSSGVLNALVHRPSVTVGGIPARVTFAGADPAVPGTSRVRFVVPADAPAGAPELAVTVHGSESNAVRLPLQ